MSTLAGAILRNTVTGKTDYLVVGTHISHGWVHTSTRVPDKAINRIISITGRGTSVGIVRA